MMSKIRKILTNTPEAFIYALALTVVTMLPYIPNNMIVLVGSFVGIFGMYYIFNELDDKNKNRVSIFAYLTSFALIVFAATLRISGTSFYTWLLTGYDFDIAFVPYIFILFLICVVFYSVSTFYFTYFYFRGYIMMGMLLVPIALYYKMVESVPVIYIICVVISLCMVYIFQIYKKNILMDSGAKIGVKDGRKSIVKIKDINKVRFGTGTRVFLIALAAVLGVISVITPKSDVAEYRYMFDEFISSNPFSNRNLSTISKVDDKSVADKYSYLSKNRILFYGVADESLYLRRSAFGRFDGETFEKLDNAYYKNYTSRANAYNLENVYSYLSTLYDMYEDVFKKYGVAKEDIPNVKEEIATIDIEPYRFTTNYFINTTRVIEMTFLTDYDSVGEIRLDRYGCLKDTSKEEIRGDYSISYYRDIARKNEDIMNFAKKFSGDEYARFIEELRGKTYESSYLLNMLDNTYYSNIQYWLDMVYTETTGNIANYNKNYSERIYELALEITKDCNNDIERIEAIEQYFKKNGYVYSNSYEPKDNSIEYFIFESKKGACGKYATAMTLMLHSLGINSRYVEGFHMSKKYPNGKYYVTAGDSHAYVEVYIPGYGYTVYEPTVSGANDEAAGVISGAINRFANVIEVGKDSAIYFVILVFVSALLAVVYKIFLHKKLVCRYIIGRCKKSEHMATVMYSYIQKNMARYDGDEIYTLTPDELRVKVMESRNVDISELTSILVSKAYGEEDVDISIEGLDKCLEIFL